MLNPGGLVELALAGASPFDFCQVGRTIEITFEADVSCIFRNSVFPLSTVHWHTQLTPFRSICSALVKLCILLFSLSTS